MKVIIIDDEYSGRTSLKILLKKYCTDYLSNIDSVSNIESAKQKFSSNFYDIVFLDIQLQGELGFELVDFINEKTKIVYVTAFSNYAISALRKKAFDYLLKPVDPEELIAVVKKCSVQGYKVDNNYLMIKNNGISIPIEKRNILYIEGSGPYSKIRLINNTLFTTAQTLKSLSIKLNGNFIRVHKSIIINILHVVGYTQKEVTLNNSIKLKVSRSGLCELQKQFVS